MNPHEANKRESEIIARLFEVRTLLREYLNETQPHVSHNVAECLRNSRLGIAAALDHLYKVRALREASSSQEKELISVLVG